MARPDSSNLPDLLLRQGVSVHPAAEPPALAASEELDFENVPAYLHGRFIPMDVFDLCAVKRLRPRPGEAVCVLRGRPQVTALIAQMVSPGGTVSACARTLEEARALASEKERLGLDNLRVVALDPAQAPSILHASFDRVFVEPESTGIGKWRRDAARKWRLRPDSHPALVAAQKDALSAALELCAAGGIAMYLTATLLREENEAVVEEVTRRMHHLKVIEQKLQLPAPAGPDGGFIARIAKLNVA
jgi:16S rRNA (cytosine967-C5)-methyltransferase